MQGRKKNKAKEKVGIDEQQSSSISSSTQLSTNPNTMYVQVPYRVAFGDAVNRVITLILNTAFNLNNIFQSPDKLISYEGETYSEAKRTYAPLIRAIRNFDPFEIVQAVYKEFENTHKNNDDAYAYLLERAHTTPMHYFIGTMDERIIRFLLEKGQRLDIPDQLGYTPLDILANVIGYLAQEKKPFPQVSTRIPSPELTKLLIDEVRIDAMQKRKHLELGKQSIKMFASLLPNNPRLESYVKAILSDECAAIYEKKKTKLFSEEQPGEPIRKFGMS